MYPGLDNTEANEPEMENRNRPAGQQERSSHLTPSESPNNSFETGAGDDTSGFDSPPIETHYLGNKDVAELDSRKPEASTNEVHGDVEPDVTANHKIPGNQH